MAEPNPEIGDASPEEIAETKEAVDQHGIPDEAYVFALEQILKGVKIREIRRSLSDAGYTAQQVKEILSYAEAYRKQNETKSETPTAQKASGYFLFAFFLWGVGILFRVAGASTSAGWAAAFLVT